MTCTPLFALCIRLGRIAQGQADDGGIRIESWDYIHGQLHVCKQTRKTIQGIEPKMMLSNRLL